MTYLLLEAAALGCQVTADPFLAQLTLSLSDCFSLIRTGSRFGGGFTWASGGPFRSCSLGLEPQHAPLMSKALG